MQTTSESLTNKLAKEIFGITHEEAINTHICIRCKSPIETTDWEAADIYEWLISGICPDCFAYITKED